MPICQPELVSELRNSNIVPIADRIAKTKNLTMTYELSYNLVIGFKNNIKNMQNYID